LSVTKISLEEQIRAFDVSLIASSYLISPTNLCITLIFSTFMESFYNYYYNISLLNHNVENTLENLLSVSSN